MGIQVEFNPDLALRAFGTPERKIEECLPEKLEKGATYNFLKKGQRNYWLEGEIPLVETKGNQQLSRPLASIKLLEVSHFKDPISGEIYTKGKYIIIDVFDINDPKIHFETMDRIKND